MKRTSDFADQYLEPEDDDPPQRGPSARPFRSRRQEATPLLTYVLAEHERARARAILSARRAWEWLARTVICFVITELPLAHWFTFAMWWVMLACGVATLNYWRAFRVARLQANLWPD